MTETKDNVSISTPPPAAQRPSTAGGCLRATLIALLTVFGLTIALGVGFLVAGYVAVDRGVVRPVAELVKQLGIEATPEIRPNPITIVRSITDLAQLQTAAYSVEKIVTSQSGPQNWLGRLFEDNLIFVAVGQVTAGVDLARLTPADIQATTFQTVTIRLPPPQVFVATLDNERSYVADRDTGLLRRADPQIETAVRRAAEAAVLEAALEQGILEVADRNARLVLEGLLKSLGFQAVVFTNDPLPPAQPFDVEPPKGFLLPP